MNLNKDLLTPYQTLYIFKTPMKVKACILFLIVILFFQNALFAQRAYNTWYFGLGAGIDFNSGSPVVITNGKTNTREGVATFSNPATGKLLFYTDGETVWDAYHRVMPNGSGLLGDGSSCQSGVIVPNPDVYTDGLNKHIYYLFTTSSNMNGFQGFRYNIVDMSLNGNGKTSGDIKQKNTLLLANNTERIGSVKHSNGKDFWIVTLERFTNKYYAYKVTRNGVNTTPVVSQVGYTMRETRDIVGYLKFSENGQKMATAFYGSDQVQIFNFDNTTGKISSDDVITLHHLQSAYGIEFAANGDLLYVSQLIGAINKIGRVWQFDLRSNNETTINQNKLLLNSTPNQGYGALQRAPDRKIYVASEIGYNGPVAYLDVINNPDAFGVGAHYQRKAIYLQGKKTLIGLPNFISTTTITHLNIPKLRKATFKYNKASITLNTGDR